MNGNEGNRSKTGFVAHRWSTLAAIVLAAFFAMGNTECGGGSSLNGGVGGTAGSGSSASSSGSTTSGPNQSTSGSEGGQDTWPDELVDDDGSTTSEGSGDQPAGSECAESAQCGAGMACTAGHCVQDGAFRITMSWDARTDLDLHVRTPLDEELYYRHRNGQQGGEFLKDGCIADDCDNDESKIESVVWSSMPGGNTSTGNTTYEFWAVNYDGTEPANVQFEVKIGDRVEIFDGSVAASNGAESATFAVALDENTSNYSFEFESPRADGTYTPHMWFKINTNNPNVARVQYKAEDWDLGDSEDTDQFPVEYTFNQYGERTIHALGFDSDGMQIEQKTIEINVTDPDGNLPGDGACTAGQASNDAQCLLNHNDQGNVTLYWTQVSGVSDDASALENIQDAASGYSASTSCYGTAPCASVNLSLDMLYGMVTLIQDYGYDYFVTSIAGGSHSATSYHYAGTAFDIDRVNGHHINGDSAIAREFMQACRDLGASEVLGPNNHFAHQTHIHCAWP
ncbi:MAG: hypothetical protein ACQEVA_07920 [Myxococcota bacterium]